MTSKQLQKSLAEIATAHPEVEFALVLARTIESARTGPEQLRGAICELAWQTHEAAAEAQRLMDALEVAIQSVEAHSKKSEKQQLVGSLTALRHPGMLRLLCADRDGDRQRSSASAFGGPCPN
jgi:hypothetical protein